MDLHRRKLWGDRVTWLLVAAATAVIAFQNVRRGGEFLRYLAYGWGVIVFFLLVTELRVGRRPPASSPRALRAGWAKLVGEERVEESGERKRGWTGAASGVMEFAPFGVRWVARPGQPGPREVLVGWPELYSWRMNGVVPILSRASGYLSLRLVDGREVTFHVQALRFWRRSLREAAIVGPTLVRPEWLPDEAGAEFPGLLSDLLDEASTEARVAAAVVSDSSGVATKPPPYRAQPPEPPAAQPAVTIPDQPMSETMTTTTTAQTETEFEPVIGLECHVELSTKSKVFCGCATDFGAPPNTQVCPVCTGQPGTLPVLNERVVEYGIRIALALNCAIAPRSIFHRKNYFYPDMPKNYQISQYDIPLGTNGWIEFDVDGQPRRVRIHRVHLEEDTGKISHAGGTGRIGEAEYAKIDYNRAGVPLVEIVSEPDIASPEEARAYLTELRALLESLGVSDVRMDQGSLRCDANVSVRPKGSEALGVKVEVKNMNSIRSLGRALDFEIERLTELSRRAERIVQETRHFDESTGRTLAGRSKEGSSDYRYFPDPDLLPLEPDPAWIERIRSGLPELPAQRRRRFVDDLALTAVDARTLTSSKGLADAFETAVRFYEGDAKAIARWYVGELSALANERGLEPHEVGVPPEHVAELQRLVDAGQISISLAKGRVLKEVAETGRDPKAVVADAGLAQISDSSELAHVVSEVIAAHPDVVEKIRSGKDSAINVLKGQVMKRTQGRANPGVVDDLLREQLTNA